MDAPMQKQLAYIYTISCELGREFTGTTKEEARQWLSKYVPIYQRRLFLKRPLYDDCGINDPNG
jgi:hypothetical protein